MTKVKTLKISEELHAELTRRGGKGQSYDKIIWNLIGVADKNKPKKKGGKADYEKNI